VIASDRITEPDVDGRMWLVVDVKSERWHEHNMDRPCDNGSCHEGWVDTQRGNDSGACCDCDGTGRHTFDIDCETPDGPRFDLRVHVIDVVPIEAPSQGEIPATHRSIWLWPSGKARMRHPEIEHDDNWRSITLPPDAKPGMWAVLLDVHESEG